MPILANAKKALRSSERKHVQNDLVRAKLRSIIKSFSINPAIENLSKVFSSIDKAVNKNLIHKNKAARMKSRVQVLIASSKK